MAVDIVEMRIVCNFGSPWKSFEGIFDYGKSIRWNKLMTKQYQEEKFDDPNNGNH
jgi:hypothetical protein